MKRNQTERSTFGQSPSNTQNKKTGKTVMFRGVCLGSKKVLKNARSDYHPQENVVYFVGK